MKIVWTIAGSDSCCGAGVQRDISVMHDLGVYPCMAITCLTSQNSQSVDLVESVGEVFFRQNLKTLKSDLNPDAIKVGLIPNGVIACCIKEFLEEYGDSRPFTVLDPVCVASTGQQMSTLADTIDSFYSLFSIVDLVTPNLDELKVLSHSEKKANSIEEIRQQAEILKSKGAKNILVKGGHGSDLNYIHDVLIENNGELTIFRSPRYDCKFTHGTGCMLSSAIASYMAEGHFLADAVTVAQTYVNQAIKNGIRIGNGVGTPGFSIDPYQEKYLPEIVRSFDEKVNQYTFPIINEQLELYPVVDSIEWIRKLLEWGVKTVQLRIKDSTYPNLEKDIAEAVELGKKFGARVFIDDYWELAIKYKAYGVHLGQEDLQTASLEKIADSGVALGVSTHGFLEIARACQINPSYIALGHIFPTKTKKMKSEPQGLERLGLYCKLLKNRKTVAIGGIKEDCFEDVMASGTGSIAVVTAITQASDPRAVVERMLRFFKNNQSNIRY